MRKIHRTCAVLVIAVAIALAAVLATGVAQALPASPQIGEQVQQGTEKASGDRLEKAKARIAKAVSKVEKLKEKGVTAFEKRIEKAKEASAKFASLGLDVTKLNADIAALEAKVSGAAREADQVIAALKKAESLATAETAEEFKTAAKDALGKVKALKKQIQEIREYAKSTIKPEIKALMKKARQDGKSKETEGGDKK